MRDEIKGALVILFLFLLWCLARQPGADVGLLTCFGTFVLFVVGLVGFLTRKK